MYITDVGLGLLCEC